MSRKNTTITLNEMGEYEIRYPHKEVIGKLIPHPSDKEKFYVQIGEYGGFYNRYLSFDEALELLINASIRNYTNRMKYVKRSATIIYKRFLKPKI